MFRDTYKSALKDIEPDSELLSKILAKGLEEKKVIHKKWVYSFGTVAASFLLVFCSVVGYMNYSDVNNIPGVVNGTNSEQVSEPYINESIDKNALKNDNVKTETVPAENKSENIPKQVVPKPKAEQTPSSAESVNEPEVIDAPSVASHEVALSEEPEVAAYSGDQTPVEREVSQIEDMTLSDYYQYIGFNVLEKINLPSDMLYSGENTVPYDKSLDKAVFSFLGDESRFANISLTKNVENLPQTDEMEKDYAKINGMYTANGMTDTFSFEILTNITEEELKELADSLLQ